MTTPPSDILRHFVGQEQGKSTHTGARQANINETYHVCVRYSGFQVTKPRSCYLLAYYYLTVDLIAPLG